MPSPVHGSKDESPCEDHESDNGSDDLTVEQIDAINATVATVSRKTKKSYSLRNSVLQSQGSKDESPCEDHESDNGSDDLTVEQIDAINATVATPLWDRNVDYVVEKIRRFRRQKHRLDFVLGEDKEIDVLEAENIDDSQTPPSDVSTGTTYKCPVCEKKYKSSSGLRSHAKKIHAKILKASEHKVKDCCEETNNEDLVSSSCQDEDSTASSTNKSRKNVSSDVTVKKGYCRPPPVYTKEALENELSRLIVQTLTEVGEDVNLKVPNSVYGLGIAHIACSIVDKVKAGSSFPSTMISELTHHLWKTVTSGDSDNTYSQYNETIWHSFFNMWANNNDVTKLMIDTFCDLLTWSTVDNDQLFRTVRLFMFRLIVIVRKQRDRADKPAVIDDEVSVSEISEEEYQALRYFVDRGTVP
ncbi:uncharacterized protein [Ptychodera flava]|uniref:uncharacterized protein n=1 Tax=Ptychodera flava TaxID=63121 RepID=UPI00396A775A